jgi:hypothetical protein
MDPSRNTPNCLAISPPTAERRRPRARLQAANRKRMRRRSTKRRIARPRSHSRRSRRAESANAQWRRRLNENSANDGRRMSVRRKAPWTRPAEAMIGTRPAFKPSSKISKSSLARKKRDGKRSGPNSRPRCGGLAGSRRRSTVAVGYFTLRTGVADSVEDLRDRDGGGFRRHPGRRLFAGDGEGPLARRSI